MKRFSYLIFALLLLGMLPALAQRTVSGTVSDGNTLEPLSGVSVRLKGTNTAVVTDNDGKFSIPLPQGKGVLAFNMIGYEPTETAAGGQAGPLGIYLTPTDNVLEEVVVSGLASTVKRRNLANSVTSISAGELTGISHPQTTDGALYGKVPGANIRSNGGAPGGGLSIQLRGLSSLQGASQPLIIVDGVYVNNSFMRTGRATVSGAGLQNQDDGANRLADINPDDIDNIEILKGPSAAAIYGTRANAGVVIITTKRGKAGRTVVSISQDAGIAKPLRLLGTDSWDEAKINTYYNKDDQATSDRKALELERYRQAVASGNFVDYEDLLYNNTRFSGNTRLNISGGNEQTRFFVGAGLSSDNGLIDRTGFQRQSIRANIDQKIGKFIQLGVNNNYIRTDTDRGFTGNQNETGASVGYALGSVPTYYDLRANADGTFPDNPYFTENPLAVIANGINNSLVNRFVESFTLGVDLLTRERSYLKFQLSGGLDYVQHTSNMLLPEDLQYQRSQANPGDLLNGKQESLNTNFQAALVYNWSAGRVNLNSQAGLVRLDFRDDILFARGQGLAPGQRNIKQSALQTVLTQRFQETQEAGIFVQQEANFEDKIIGTVGVRFDKSSLNGDANKFYTFPKASLAVNLTAFDFLRDQFVSQLKPRIAYGETAGPVTFGDTFTPLLGVNIGGLLGSVVSSTYGNTQIRPETAKELEFGVDLGFFNNKLSLEATYYIKNTENNVQTLTLSPSTGVTSITSNLAALENKGIELALTGRIIQQEGFSWTGRLMYWKNDVVVTRLDIPSYTLGGFGSSLGVFLIKEGERLGTIVGTPQVSPGVFTDWGNSQPDFFASMSHSLSYKAFDLSFLLEWKKGGDNINLYQYLTDEGGTSADWSKDDNGDGIPNGRQRDPAPYNNAGRWIQDASYIKLREAGLYYSMPRAITGQLFRDKVQRFRVGLSGTNLLMFTNYPGYDPETSNFGVGLANNIDVAPYPSARRLFLNLSLDF